MDNTNRVTGLMLAAACMMPGDIYRDILSRQYEPCKAPAPEYGLDVPRIFEASKKMRRLRILRDIFAIVIFVTALPAVARVVVERAYGGDGTSRAWIWIFVATLLLAAAQFVFTRMQKGHARRALAAISDEDEYAAGAFAGQNLMVSGDFVPFVGAGGGRSGWSFTVNLMKPEMEGAPVGKLETPELYSEASTNIGRLRLQNLAVSDLAFVDGRDVSKVPSLLPRGRFHNPVLTISEEEMRALIGKASPNLRHYRVIRASLWGGQVVLSMFHRYVRQGDLLFVEAAFFALYPLKERFLKLEHLPAQAPAREIVEDAVLSLIKAPFLGPSAALRAMWALLTIRGRFKNHSKAEIKADGKYNYGWEKSLREHWSSENYERYFQRVDLDFYEKSINEALLDGLLESLRSRNISVESIKEASTRIFNAGVMVTGGTLNAESVAAGKGATAGRKIINRLTPQTKAKEVA